MTAISNKQTCSVVAVASLLGMSAASASAQSAHVSLPFEKPGVYVESDTGAAQRIDVADRLRTISQEVAAAACHMNNAVAVEANRAVLVKAHAEFLGITDALLNGSASYHIAGRETRPKTLRMITDVISTWTSTDGAVMALLDAPQNRDALATIQRNHPELEKQTSALIGQLTAEYAAPFELLLGDAVMIDVAGRLGMLTQRISDEVCAIWSGNRSEDDFDALSATIVRFGVSVTSLRDGDKVIGIKPAPTPQIAKALDEVAKDWSALHKMITEAVADEGASEKEKVAVLKALTANMYKLNGIVDLYTSYAKNETT